MDARASKHVKMAEPEVAFHYAEEYIRMFGSSVGVHNSTYKVLNYTLTKL